jgi:hypothetical protein
MYIEQLKKEQLKNIILKLFYQGYVYDHAFKLINFEVNYNNIIVEFEDIDGFLKDQFWFDDYEIKGYDFEVTYEDISNYRKEMLEIFGEDYAVSYLLNV